MWSRRQLLRAGSGAGLLGASRPSFAQSSANPPRHLIVVLIEGGWDVTYCLDPKEGCPDAGGAASGPGCDPGTAGREEVTTFGGLTVATNQDDRPNVASFFSGAPAGFGPRFQRCHVVNGVWTGSIAHDPCRTRMLTGTLFMTNPDVSVITGAVHGGADRPLGSVDLSGWSFSGSLAATTGRIGYQSQIKALVDPNTPIHAPSTVDWTYPLFDASADQEAAVANYLRERATAYRTLHDDGPDGHNNAVIDGMLESIDRAAGFKAQGATLLDSLQIGAKADFPDQIEIAISLIKNNVCHSVMLDSRYEWDTHEINVVQHANYNGLFQALAQLYDRLFEEGLFEDTVVAVISEMTRTPLLNAAGGKDHWPHTSALLFGGGVRGNVTTGATNDLVESQTVDLVTGELLDEDAGGSLIKYDNFCAGVLDLVGVVSDDWLPGVVPYQGMKA